MFGRTVEVCTRHAWGVIVIAVLLGAGSAWFASRHFAIDTDVSRLLSPQLPWRKNEAAMKTAFPALSESIIVVVRGRTPELAAVAAHALATRLSADQHLFPSVQEAGGDEFFARSALLYRPPDDLERLTHQLATAAPLIRALATDPSLRGLAHTLSFSLRGVQAGRNTLADMQRPLELAAGTIEQALAGQPAAFSWQALVNGAPPTEQDLRRLIMVRPRLDFGALEPGQAATTTIRQAVQELHLEPDAKVELTGPIPIADQELGTLREGVGLNGAISAVIALAILWLAMRSWRIVAAIVVNLAVGLAMTAAVGLLLVGALNPISMAFVVLFVGLGADFAIQFGIRYRAERHAHDDLHHALLRTAEWVGAPLTLAAAAAAAGFFSFTPTSYWGLAELGLIAGCGMAVAFAASMTLLPALLTVLRAPTEPAPLSYPALAPADSFLRRHRILIVACTSIAVLAASPLLLHLRFDFNPMSLRDPNSEAVAALRALADRQMSANVAQVLTPASNLADTAKSLRALPEVAQVGTIDALIPADQEQKLALVAPLASALQPALQARPRPSPSDAENIAALHDTARNLNEAAGEADGPGPAAARRLAEDLDKLAQAQPAVRTTAETAFVQPLQLNLQQLRLSLRPKRITQADLPPSAADEWMTSDGRARIEVTPKGDMKDDAVLRGFAQAVLAVAPNAAGPAIQAYEWGTTITTAFAHAALWALGSILVLLWIVLRRLRDVLVTLIPLLVAAAVTLEICAATNFPLNYANIIALPLLLGVGVAFKIYYVMAWRGGETAFLQSPLTRAVFFSALMTAAAFGSLYFSNHPGMSSMGKLLALSLLCTLASAALFQPALMGPPPSAKKEILAQ